MTSPRSCQTNAWIVEMVAIEPFDTVSFAARFVDARAAGSSSRRVMGTSSTTPTADIPSRGTHGAKPGESRTPGPVTAGRRFFRVVDLQDNTARVDVIREPAIIDSTP